MWTQLGHQHQDPTSTQATYHEARAPAEERNPNASNSTQLLDHDSIVRTMALPQPSQYPKAPVDLFQTTRAQSALNNICASSNYSMQADLDYSSRGGTRRVKGKTVSNGYVCDLKLTIPGIAEEAVAGGGETKTAARSAAFLYAVSQLHSNGSLKTLLTQKGNVPAEVSADTGLQDVQYWTKQLAVPTKKDYPDAPKRLFESKYILESINLLSQKLSFNTNLDFSSKPLSKDRTIHICNLSLEIPDMCQETGLGEGLTKAAAKQAAWWHVMLKLHASGTMKELFPGGDSKLAPADVQAAKDMTEPATLDEQRLQEEKDAKVEIYNYAAALLSVPRFDIQQVRARASRPSYRRPAQKAKVMHQVTITLPELGLEATGAGNTLLVAETMAAVDFKRAAEERHKMSADVDSPKGQAQHSLLNTDTAKDFFTFLKDVRSHLNVEVETESIKEASVTRNMAHLTVDGTPVGQPVKMNTKKEADSIAHLTAAVEICKQEPELLTQFAQRLKKGKGKVLEPLGAVDLLVDAEALYVMRNALVEAREAGLPDTREVLSATEQKTAEETPRRRRRALAPHQIETASTRLAERQQAFEKNPALSELRSKKASLPMNQQRSQVLQMVSDNSYSIVVGATGSGKTTQVPQILLEDHIASGTGGACNIICTQPRRIAATSVAQRVAVERDERLQESVGYHVRFDAKLPQLGGSITYCTTGILLEQLKHDPDMLDSISHLIVDEVHERDLNIDFLMIVVKKALQARRVAGKTLPRVVLMSATLDTELFAKYFAHTVEDGTRKLCPSISVPGRTFPVKDTYLGSLMHELLQSHRSELNRFLELDRTSHDYLQSETAFSAKENKAAASSAKSSVIDWKRERPTQSDSEEDNTAKQEKEEAMVPTALLAATIAHICKTTRDGAILAFLPGLEEILRTQRHLLEQPVFGQNFHDTAKFKICLLHSTVPKEEQSAIFEPSPPGCRKIILSTNIAETSVTVTDVRYVVDTGKLREKRYDQVRRITKLQCVWESKSNSKQRAGRAGRVQDGYYYALFSKERHDALRAVGLPELLRSDLQETCLSIKAQKFQEPIETFLAQAIEPPPPRAIRAAVTNLTAIEAFTDDEKLTDVGSLLARLPIHPALGKMIVLGVIFKCLDPMLILGAASEERSLFVTPLGTDARANANSVRRRYADGEPSDHLAMLKAFQELRALRDQHSVGAAFDRGRESFLHMGAFRTIDQTAKQIVDILTECGLITESPDVASRTSGYGPASLNRNSGNTALIQSLLLAGVHPNLAAKQTSRGMSYRTSTERGVLTHPGSLNDDSKRKENKHKYGTLVAYSALAKSNDGNSLFMRDTTIVTPLMTALFGGKLTMTKSCRLEMDDWLPFFIQAGDREYATKLVLEFRKAFDRVLNSAFRSLAHLDSESRTDFANDPMREKFASRVVQVLDHASGRAHTKFWTAARWPRQMSPGR